MKKMGFNISRLFGRGSRKEAANEMPRLEVETVDVELEGGIVGESGPTISADEEITVSAEVVSVIPDQDHAPDLVVEAEIVDFNEEIEIAISETVSPKKEEAETLPAEKKPVVMAFRADEGMEGRHRFGEYVYRKGLISRTALHAASLEQTVTGAKIGQILVANGHLSDKDRIEAVLATEHSRISQEKVSKTKIPVEVLAEHNIIISAEQDDRVYVSSSEDERMVKMIVSQYYPGKEIEMVSYDASAMNLFLSSMMKMTSIDDPANAEQLMLDRIVYRALTELASDIHIEPRATSYNIFYRIDGVRTLIHTGNMTEYQVLIAKIKDRAAMDLAERRKPQDGGFQMEYAGKMIDLRIATAPVAEGGEKCVIRLLDSDRVQPSLEKLGITEVTKWRKGLRHQAGICFICGPTGSGKTTTFSASVREMDRFGRSIYSIEDPVEYRIPFVSQVAVNRQVGLDFATGIRAFMRMDPDVMIVGEVRDRETAQNAITAAETGHLVLATLHTHSIVGTITRLKELGIEPHELRYLVRAIMVQSLVRTLCPDCKGHEVNKFECRTCGGSGYKGRTVVSECEYFDGPEAVNRIIPEAGKTIEETWTTKEQDAVNKMYAGITDFAELDRQFGPAIERYLREEDRR
jgi:type II secretory ATPase GspE/PulE/Tfp pilus assembly ATPase PilB-like protein|nr:GspE/PulE family protein [Neorhizobium tomejilense]